MSSRKRRRSSPTPLRAVGLIALNLAALALLWSIWPRDVDASAPQPEQLALSAALPATPRAETGRRDKLERDLQALIARAIEKARVESKGKADAGNVEVAVCVRELGGGADSEVAIAADRPLRPASNMKLVTTAAALVLLGPEFQFDTRFEAAGAIDEGTLRGDLVVRAAADPLYERDGNGDVEKLFAPAIAALRDNGITRVAGDLVLDEATFVAPGPGPEWPDVNQHGNEYCALAAAFSVNRGCVTANVTPAEIGAAARVGVFPRDHGWAENLGVRTEAGGKVTIQMHARPSGVLVKGTIGARSRPWSDACAAPDPVAMFGHVLAGALERNGVVVEGAVRRERGAPPGQVVAHLRTPLSQYLTAINTDSTNSVADQVFLASAYATSGFGTREAGQRATRAALDKLGVPSRELVQVDGSGLSRANRVTARQIAALIEAVLLRDEQSAMLYRDSLALAGETGTLDDRMKGTPARARVRAKTGFIAGTSALSGVVLALDNRSLVFSILVNYPELDGLNASCWKPMQDEICVRLVGGKP